MPIEPKHSITMAVVFAVLLLLALLCWVPFALNATSLHVSDRAGTAMSQGLAFIFGGAVWTLLALAFLVAGLQGRIPASAKGLAIVLIPVSGAASLATVQIMGGNPHPGEWLLVAPILMPPLLALYAIWAYIPSLRATISPVTVDRVVWGAVFVLSVLPWPFILQCSTAREQQQNEAARMFAMQEEQRIAEVREERLARLNSVPSDAPLWEWIAFTSQDGELRQKALEKIRHVASRQTDAENMLEAGAGFPLVELPNLNLEATPALCENARKYFRKRVQWILPSTPDDPYSSKKDIITSFLPGIAWLVQHGCDCSDELTQAEAAVRAYPKTADRNQMLETLARILQSGSQ